MSEVQGVSHSTLWTSSEQSYPKNDRTATQPASMDLQTSGVDLCKEGAQFSWDSQVVQT